MAGIVRIACMIPNGTFIRLYRPGFDDGTGVKQMTHDGPAVRLNGTPALHTGAGAPTRADLEPGITEVEAGWWAKWLEQNPKNALLEQKQIYAIEDHAETKGPNPTTAA